MENRVNLNGTLKRQLPGEEALGRGYRYGDALFETIRLEDGGMLLLADHVARLQSGLELLGIADGARYTAAWLEEETAGLAGLRATGRVRLTVGRAAGGKYSPTADVSRFVLEFEPTTFPNGWRGPDLRVGLSDTLRMPTHPLANLKSTSALAYIQAARERQANGWDEILLRNHHGRISEGGYTNVFAYINGIWCTPPATEGGVSGVLRAYLLGAGAGSIVEKPLTVAALEDAESIACTNALHGIHPVVAWESRRYSTAPIRALVDLLPPTRKR